MVVAPSLAGFTFSFESGQRRLDIVEMADLFARLMTEGLGYPRFAAQGGDRGAYVLGRLAHALLAADVTTFSRALRGR